MNKDMLYKLPASQFSASYPADIADEIASLPIAQGLEVFQSLEPTLSVSTFEYLPFPVQAEILKSLPSDRVAQLLNALSPDDRTGLLQELPTSLVNLLLKYLSPEERALSLQLLNYPEHSVGRLMTPDYIDVKMDWTVKQVLDYIRSHGRDSETVDVIYVVDDDGHLVDDIRIRQFLFADPKTTVSELSDRKFIALKVDEDEEEAVKIFRKYARSALPVVDADELLLGIVTFDDIMNVAVNEDTEDIQKIGGVEALDAPYLNTSLSNLVQKRVVWLIVLFMGELMTASAMGYFEDEIAKAVVLALFIPLIISSGGNAGSQASTLVIRAMALGEVTLRDWWRVMRREIVCGLFLGTALGLIGFFRIFAWSQFSDAYGAHWALLGTTLFFTLLGVVIWGTVSGAMAPIILKRLGLDPAVASAPLVATLVDVTGLVIYFTVAMVVLRGTLL
ncbi:MAG: magnesium transporter [Chlamydiales bacterium]|nr:magnesium transporter [Chlamydiales bacterium]